MSFQNLVIKRRSIRKYQNTRIEKDKLNIILKSGLMSPSSRNSKPVDFVVVENPDMLEKLSHCRVNCSQFMANAPAAIVVCVDAKKSTCSVEDASIAAITLQYQAEDFDIGSCWIHIHNREIENGISSENYVKNLLQIPDNLDVICIIALGYKNEQKNKHSETELDLRKIHFDKF